jgi:hypothetical protein
MNMLLAEAPETRQLVDILFQEHFMLDGNASFLTESRLNDD